MTKKRTLTEISTGKIIEIEEDNCLITTYKDLVKSGFCGRLKQYKYFCEHPNEVEDQRLFSELEKEFGDDNT